MFCHSVQLILFLLIAELDDKRLIVQTMTETLKPKLMAEAVSNFLKSGLLIQPEFSFLHTATHTTDT
jgi:hypothetical protein